MGEFRMPALGAGMDYGRILEWYVKPGDHVLRGGIIALVATDKANIDVEVFEDGVVEELLVEAGTEVDVGTPLARIGPATTDTTPASGLEPGAPTVAEAIDEHPFVISPLVRRQAREAGVDLKLVRGTGPAGAITRRDVTEAATLAVERPSTGPIGGPTPAAGAPSSPYARRLAAERELDVAGLAGSGPAGAIVARDLPGRAATTTAEAGPKPTPAPEPSRAPGSTSKPAAAGKDERALAMRQAIARAMERSNREIPHYYLGETVDVEAMLVWLSERNAELPPARRVLPAAVVLKATALALREFPDFNGYWIDDAFRAGEGIHLGVAINLRRGGLLAPAMRDVDQRSLDEVMEALKDLVQRTRADGLRGSELTDPTITVSNLGDTGVESIHGVITPPQVALVGVGRITVRPWAVDGLLAVRRTLALSLAGDHRASDGHRGGRLLAAIAANLSTPEML